jgi:hypothetical protein
MYGMRNLNHLCMILVHCEAESKLNSFVMLIPAAFPFE